MYQVKTYNAISEKGIDLLKQNGYDINKTNNADAYLIRSIDLHQADFPNNLKVISRAGAGFNNIPLDKVTRHGIAAFNTPGSNANAVKEVIIAMLIASSRNLFEIVDFSSKNVNADISLMKKHDNRFKGKEILGKNIAVIGLGHVGSLVANAAINLGMNVIGYDPYLSSDAAWNISNTVKRADSVQNAIRNADYVTVHVPKKEDTLNLISTDELKKMKSNATLFNYSRLGIVDNQAVIKALDNKKINKYVTDFGEDILEKRRDIIITPHIGGSTKEAEANGSVRGANIIMNYLTTGNVKDALNLPDLNVPFKTKYRLTLIHNNIPNMVGQITTMLANYNINIESMNNAAKDDNAYTVIDLVDYPGEQLIKQLKMIDSIHRARLIEN